LPVAKRHTTYLGRIAPLERMKDEFDILRARLNGLARRLGRLARRSRPALSALGALLIGVLVPLLETLLALLIIFEEWGWRQLADLLGRLGRWRPWATVEAWIIRLPPYAALVVFALPTLLLLPLKFLALLLIAGKHVALAGLLFIAAKLVATALIARLFMLTQPALMRIGWFASAHDTLIPWKEALVARVHASSVWRTGHDVKARVLHHLLAQWVRWRPAVLRLAAWARLAAARLFGGGRARFGAARRWLSRAISR
jgi:hypothetical protein